MGPPEALGQMVKIPPISDFLKPIMKLAFIVRGDRDSRANLMPIYGDLYQIKF